MKRLNELEHRLKKRRAKTRRFRRFMIRSAVAAIVRPSADNADKLEVLLIKRAESERDRWSGHMALPGGRLEGSDRTARAAAMRETEEEIGLSLQDAQYIGRLSDVMTIAHGKKKPMVVSPYCFQITGEPELVLNYEVAEVVWVPLEFLANHENRDTMRWERNGVGMTLPCYFYSGYRIWGLTLRMLDELTRLAERREKH